MERICSFVGGRVGRVKEDSFSLARASDYLTTADQLHVITQQVSSMIHGVEDVLCRSSEEMRDKAVTVDFESEYEKELPLVGREII
jgi:hypothetical protein